jgi:hypothetical protein
MPTALVASEIMLGFIGGPVDSRENVPEALT